MDGFEFLDAPGPLNSGATASESTPVEPDMAAPEPGMSEEDFMGAFRAAVADAEDYTDSWLAPLRAEATRFYRGDYLGDAEDGLSQIVMTEVRDSVLGVVPSLLRTFVGGDHPVEFVPQNPASVEVAKQQTDYVSYVLMQDNPGFILLHSLIKDALVRKLGVLKWRWSEDVTVTETRFTGLFAEQITILRQDPTCEIVELAENIQQQAPDQSSPVDSMIQSGAQSPVGQQTPPAPPLFDCRIRRRTPAHRLVIEAIPPEEFIFNRDARDLNDERGYYFVGHRSIKTISEIVAMGYDREEIEEHAGGSDMLPSQIEQNARNPAINSLMGATDSPDESQHRVMFIEAYIRIDRDGDGIAELHKVHAVGDAYHVLNDEVVDQAPFAVFCPDPEPHMAVGSCVADQTMDLQRIKSNIMRNTLDSLALSIHPRTVVMENQTNMDDAMNTEPGSMIRVRQAGAVQELTKTFQGPVIMPVLGYLDQIKSKRTGLTDAAQGLSPEMLQSATQDAVMATITGAQERIETYARILAETAMKRLFRGIAKTLRENQDQPRMVKLRGQFVAVDPRSWVGELECVPNVSLGRGTDQQRMGFLSMIAQKQEMIMEKMGYGNSVAGADRYIATLTEMVTLAGFKDASKYFGQVTPEMMQQLQAPKPPQAADILAQAEMLKVQTDAQYKQAKLQQEQFEAVMQNKRETLKIILTALTALEATNSQYGLGPNQQLIDSLLQHERDMAEVQANYASSLHGNNAQAGAQVQSAAIKAAMQPQQPQLQAPQPGIPQ
jgi:hypothetical protein